MRATVSRPPVVELVQVGKSYPASGDVLHGINIRFAAGEMVAIVGPSGSGKSTLLQIMGTLERPSRGAVCLDGHDLAGLSEQRLSALRANRIGFVFQSFFLFEDLTALANVETALLYCGTPRSERRRMALDALDKVGLTERDQHRPSQLSGGEQQRVAIARALVKHPALILADEPTGNLDSRHGDEVIALLLAANETGATLAVVTHDRDLASRFDRRVELRDGALIADARCGTA